MSSEESDETYFLFSSSPNQLSICMDNTYGGNNAILTRTIGSFGYLNSNEEKPSWPAWQWSFECVPCTAAYTIQSVMTGYYLNGSTTGTVNATAKGSSLSSSQTWIPGDAGSVTIGAVRFHVRFFQNSASGQYLQYPSTQNAQAITTVSSLTDQCYWLMVSVDRVPSTDTSQGALGAVVTTNLASKDDLKSDEKEMESVKYQDMKKRDSNATGYDLKGLPNVLANYESMVPNKTDRILMAELAHSQRFDTLSKYFDYLKLDKDTHFKAEAVVNHVSLHTHKRGMVMLDATNGTGVSQTAVVSLSNQTGYSMTYLDQDLLVWNSSGGSVPSSIGNGSTSGSWQTTSISNGKGTSGDVRYTFGVNSNYKVKIKWVVEGNGNTNTNDKKVKKQNDNGNGWSDTNDFVVTCPTPTNSSNTFDFGFVVQPPYIAVVSLTNNTGGDMSYLSSSLAAASVPASINNGSTSSSWQTQSDDTGTGTTANVIYTFTVSGTNYKAKIKWQVAPNGSTANTNGSWIKKQKQNENAWIKDNNYNPSCTHSINGYTTTFAFSVGAPPS